MKDSKKCFMVCDGTGEKWFIYCSASNEYLDDFGVPYLADGRKGNRTYFKSQKEAQFVVDHYNMEHANDGDMVPVSCIKDLHAPGAKDDKGKPLAGILGGFARALLRVVDVGTEGAEKYSRDSWQSVENGVVRYDDAKWRHLLKGYINPIDPEFDIEHAAHEAWNALAKLELMLREKEKQCE